MPDYIALVRRKSSALPAEFVSTLRGLNAQGRTGMVFLHGDGVTAAADGSSLATRAEVHVCRTSWRRRYGAMSLAAPFRESSLAVLFSAVAGARRLDSCGQGGSACDRVASGRPGFPVLIELGFAPESPRSATEALELVLAAAALEMKASILLTGAGEHHLTGAGARAWRQLTDFDLLPFYVARPAHASAHAAPARPLDAAGEMRLRGAAGLLMLG